jgi:hypothetical protein
MTFTLTTYNYTPQPHLINFNSINSLLNYLKHTNKNHQHLISNNLSNPLHIGNCFIISYNQILKNPLNLLK